MLKIRPSETFENIPPVAQICAFFFFFFKEFLVGVSTETLSPKLIANKVSV